MNNTIVIGSPYIKYVNENIRLCSMITRPSGEFEFYFELPSEYEKYLCHERSDSFVLAILEYAMFMGYDIECEAPLAEALYYQLRNYGISIFSQNLSFLKNIKINAPITSEIIESEGAVGTGFSAGVDSFYTVLKHIKPDESSYRLTHLLIVNNGAFTHSPVEHSGKLFHKQVERLTPVARELGLPLIPINTNSTDFYIEIGKDDRNSNYVLGPNPIKIAACVYALQKLFSVYFIASGMQMDKFKFSTADPNLALLFHVKMCSSDSIVFYESGSEVNRLQKVEYIASNEVVQKHLSVDYGNNCSHCKKCLRTMFELYSINMLDKFDSVFDVDDFKKHLSNRIGSYLTEKGDRYDGFIKECTDMCKKNKIHIPFSAYIKAYFVYKPFKIIKSILRKSKRVRKFYYKYDIDIKLYGEDARVARYTYLQDNEK